MAVSNKSKRNLKPIKKGEVRNKGGPKKKPEEIKVFEKINREFVELKITEFLRKKKKELKEILNDEDREALDHFMASIVLKGVYEGCYRRMEFLFNRLIGKVVERYEYTPPEPFIIEGTQGQRVQLGMREQKNDAIIDVETTPANQKVIRRKKEDASNK